MTIKSLYLPEDQIARAVLGTDHIREWPSIAAALELEGLPKIDRLTGRRYWPAVRAFLDRRHGIGAQMVPSQADGDERWS